MIKNTGFLDLLVSRELITRDAYHRLGHMHRGDAHSILKHLVRAIPQKKTMLARLWGDSIGVAFVDLSKTLFQREVVLRIPEEFARRNHIVLLYQFGDAITAALSDPANEFILKEAEKITGKPISPVFALSEDIEAAIEMEYQSEDHLRELSSKIVTDSIVIEDITELTRDELQNIAGSKGVVEFVKGLLILAVRQRASDVHIEPGEEKVKVRFRIDGILQEKSKLDSSLLAPVISRLKILAELDITERRRPQDGRISLALPNRSIDFRLSTVPTIHGEKAVLRILGESRSRDVPALSELCLSRNNLYFLQRVMDSPHGIFFVTGPTGSGKTTTLFSMLQHLNKPGVNITTIEDPVEYRLPGINQVQLNAAAELDFPSALRSFLRQDPDILLVGEIRDTETAEIACRAALTGHLVLATLHANNALQATTRLLDMGLEPHVVAPSMIGIMSQRLVRKICENCREKYNLPPDEIRKFLACDGAEVALYRGKGCPQCNNSGYSGRIAVHEVMLINGETRSQILHGASPMEIYHSAKKAGFKSMRYDGMKKVLRGLTTIEELERVTMVDEES